MIKYHYRCILNYVPSSYVADRDWQERNRKLVYEFKEGKYGENYMKKFQYQCQRLIKDMAIDWVVCFAPCSCEDRKIKRFGRLNEYLTTNLPCKVYLDTFAYLGEKYPSCLSFPIVFVWSDVIFSHDFRLILSSQIALFLYPFCSNTPFSVKLL